MQVTHSMSTSGLSSGPVLVSCGSPGGLGVLWGSLQVCVPPHVLWLSLSLSLQPAPSCVPPFTHSDSRPGLAPLSLWLPQCLGNWFALGRTLPSTD